MGKDTTIVIRVSDDEKKRVKAAANEEYMTVSAYIRKKLGLKPTIT